MPNPFDPTQQREFRCEHCKGLIRIPAHLPSTTGPCPHCGGTITSPAPGTESLEEHELQDQPHPEEITVPAKGQKIRNESEVDYEYEDENQQTRRSYLAVVLGLLGVASAIVIGVLLALQEMNKPQAISKDKAVVESEAVQEAHYIRVGWKKDAYQVLDGFIKGTSTQEKKPYVHFGDSLTEKMDAFYTEKSINDSDTPAEAFSVFNLSEEDRKRGLFMLVFDRPPQFSMRDFFRPLATLEVQYGLAEADLLLASMARVSNFATDPLRVHAFFKRTPDGLKLDWEIFAQTKYRMLQNFLEVPVIGQTKVFRLFIVEDVPDQRFSIITSRTYRIADPANTDHSARIIVPVDSDVGRQLSAINWIGSEEKKPDTRTATVELEWRGTESQPYLAIKRFLCWEFLGLGGAEQAAKSADSTRENP